MPIKLLPACFQRKKKQNKSDNRTGSKVVDQSGLEPTTPVNIGLLTAMSETGRVITGIRGVCKPAVFSVH